MADNPTAADAAEDTGASFDRLKARVRRAALRGEGYYYEPPAGKCPSCRGALEYDRRVSKWWCRHCGGAEKRNAVFLEIRVARKWSLRDLGEWAEGLGVGPGDELYAVLAALIESKSDRQAALRLGMSRRALARRKVQIEKRRPMNARTCQAPALEGGWPEVCGKRLDPGSRTHKQTCDGACQKRLERARKSGDTPPAKPSPRLPEPVPPPATFVLLDGSSVDVGHIP